MGESERVSKGKIASQQNFPDCASALGKCEPKVKETQGSEAVKVATTEKLGSQKGQMKGSLEPQGRRGHLLKKESDKKSGFIAGKTTGSLRDGFGGLWRLQKKLATMKGVGGIGSGRPTKWSGHPCLIIKGISLKQQNA